jgi:3-oxoacyl-[acyl-carrier protein] reductase
MLLQDKVALIYGGGGAIGGAVARAFAREGARVQLAGRTLSKLERVAQEIRQAGGHAETAELDALDEQQVEAHADRIAARTGRIDIALNAIGVHHVQGVPLAQLSLADFEAPIHAYVRANYLSSRAVARHMVERRAGVILSLSTPGSRMSGVGFLGYGTTCSAVEGFSRILAGELGASGVRVVCLRPHAIPEALELSHAREVFRGIADPLGLSVEAMLAERAQNGTLLGRLPTLHQVAQAAVFAASDGAGAFTAAVMNLSCGSVVD